MTCNYLLTLRGDSLDKYLRDKLENIETKLDQHGEKLEEIRVLQARQNGKVNQNCKDILSLWDAVKGNNSKAWSIIQVVLTTLITIVIYSVII